MAEFKPPIDTPVYVTANVATGLAFHLTDDTYTYIEWNDNEEWRRLADVFHRKLWEWGVQTHNLAMALMGVEHDEAYTRWKEVEDYVLNGGDLCNSA